MSFYGKNVVPIGVLFALSLGFSNLAAVRLSVSFIQMVKAMTPLIALGISVYMKTEHLTNSLAMSAWEQPARPRRDVVEYSHPFPSFGLSSSQSFPSCALAS
jgi:hypothetical protein